MVILEPGGRRAALTWALEERCVLFEGEVAEGAASRQLQNSVGIKSRHAGHRGAVDKQQKTRHIRALSLRIRVFS